jgi:hypothetical protein
VDSSRIVGGSWEERRGSGGPTGILWLGWEREEQQPVLRLVRPAIDNDGGPNHIQDCSGAGRVQVSQSARQLRQVLIPEALAGSPAAPSPASTVLPERSVCLVAFELSRCVANAAAWARFCFTSGQNLSWSPYWACREYLRCGRCERHAVSKQVPCNHMPTIERHRCA